MTATEIHTLELGADIGLLAYFGVQIGQDGVILTLPIDVVRSEMSDGCAKGDATMAIRRLGFHDVRLEPPSFGAGFLLAFVGDAIDIAGWTALGIGSTA